VLAAVVLAEKLWVHGEVLARVVDIAAPRLRYRRDLGARAGTGLHESSQMMNMAGS